MGCQHVFDDADDLLLMMTRQPRHLFKNLLGFAGRSGAALLLFIMAKQVVGTDSERCSQGRKLFRSQSDRLPLPPTQGALLHAQLVGQFALAQASRFAGRDKTFTERRPLPICRSAHL